MQIINKFPTKKVNKEKVCTLQANLPPTFLPEFSKFSTWTRLLGAKSRLLDAKDKLKKNINVSKLKQQNLALELWVKEIQKDSFLKEITSLKSNKMIAKDSRLMKISPFLDQNELLRVNGRI